MTRDINKIYHKISDLATLICQKESMAYTIISKDEFTFADITFPHWYDLTGTGIQIQNITSVDPTIKKIDMINVILNLIELGFNLDNHEIETLESYYNAYKD